MPNPVLLAVANSTQVKVHQQELHGQLTELFEITVEEPRQGTAAPLWILDGQHRVKGMSESTQKNNPIPLVLLHGDASSAYSPQQFARVFAEVTTYATPLVPLHEEWLRFAFKLGLYGSGAAGSTMHWNSMNCVALLCDLQNVGENDDANPFHDRVQLNPERASQPAIGEGFNYNALALKDLIYSSYFALPGATLGSQALAEQIALAVLALSRNDTTTQSHSAFFGEGGYRQKYLQDAFLVGVCAYLRSHQVPKSWDVVLQQLTFNAVSWDVTSWVETTGGNSGNVSRVVSNKVFGQAFANGTLPAEVSSLPTFLQGDTASIDLRASDVSDQGRMKRTGFNQTTFPINGTKAFNIGNKRHIRIVGESLNVGKLDVIDTSAPLDQEFSASKLRRGVYLPENAGSVRLLLRAEFYGGTKSELKLSVTWT